MSFQEAIKQILPDLDIQVKGKGSLVSRPFNHLSETHRHFRNNLLARITRVCDHHTDPETREKVKTLIQNLHTKEYAGAMAELCVLDFCRGSRIEMDKTPDNPLIAENFGCKKVDVDVYFKDFDIYTDVKVFKINSTEILHSICSRVWPKGSPVVSCDNIAIFDYKIMQQHIPSLISELQKVKPGQQSLQSETIPDLTFRFEWGRKWTSELTSCNPYRFAQDYHELFLRKSHAKKFPKNQKYFTTAVSLPWYNEMSSDFQGYNEKLYRSIARRVFCQYMSDGSRYKDKLEKDYSGEDTIFEVSKHLGGILFLDDNVILGENPGDVNVKAYFFNNPNAYRNIWNSSDMLFHSFPPTEKDTFEFDNY